jgi:hypothetical protein
METELEDKLHSGRGIFIEAPAGHGKTFIILNTISRYPFSRQLVLTHTIAGVAALRGQMTNAGLGDENANINTIAGWTQRYVRSYPTLAGIQLIELDAMEPGNYWTTIAEGFCKLLEKRNIIEIIKANYEGVYIDEYQDCNNLQHKLVKKLSGILPVRVLGDPLQGIFDFNNEMVPWDEVSQTFEHLATLETPYRWINASNPEYGDWLLGVRQSLMQGSPIDLTTAPNCVEVVLLTGRPADDVQTAAKEAKKPLPADYRRLIIGDKQNAASKNLVKTLSRPRYTLIESLDSKDVGNLRAYAATIDATGKDEDIGLITILADCFTGMSTVKASANRIKTDAAYAPREKILLTIKEQRNHFDPEIALRIIKAVEGHTSTSCHRRQMITIMEMSLASWIAGSYTSFADAMVASIESIRQRGRKLPRFAIGSTLLVKGLEVEEVLLLDAHKLGRRDLYVALTRPTKNITILSTSSTLTPQ